jgi:NADPH2:quinone reductase
MSGPDEMELKDAVAVLADGRTAIALISQAQLRAGEIVLIEAAAGGVGSLLVQLAKAAGARVVAVAGGERKVTLARELGADVAIDYSKESWTSEVENALTSATSANGTHPLDVVFDGVGGAIGRAAFDLLERGGRHCAFGMASGAFAAIDERDGTARGVKVLRGTRLDPPEMRRLTRSALEEVATGRLHPVVGQTFPLADAAQAHRAIETRSTVGKTLLIT